MNGLAVSGLLGVIALIFFVAERSLSLFSWSRLEELTVPRARRQAAEKCLENRELVSTCFLVIGGAAVAALSVILVKGTAGAWPAAGQAALLALLVTWILPELAAWRVRDRVTLYVVPLLYRLVGVPFRALRVLLVKPAASAGGEGAAGEGESAAEPPAPDAEAHEVFKMAVRLQHTQVREIMTPRTEMVSIADTATIREAAEASVHSGYSRLPVYRGNRDQIIGVLHVKDLLALAGTEKWDKSVLAELARPPFLIPETKTISELMEEFQGSNTHMGIVLDEYGGTSGVVTLEDVVEELIGEIHDEYEDVQEEMPPFRWLDSKSVEVQAMMRIEEFNEEFNLDLPEQEDFDTIGGFVTFVLGKIPVNGESFQFSGARFTVMEADPRHVIRARVDFGHDHEHRPGEKV